MCHHTDHQVIICRPSNWTLSWLRLVKSSTLCFNMAYEVLFGVEFFTISSVRIILQRPNVMVRQPYSKILLSKVFPRFVLLPLLPLSFTHFFFKDSYSVHNIIDLKVTWTKLLHEYGLLKYLTDNLKGKHSNRRNPFIVLIKLLINCVSDITS